MWEVARLRSASAMVTLALDLAALALGFPLPLPLPGRPFSGFGTNLLNEQPSLPWFECAMLELACVLTQWPGYVRLFLLVVSALC